MQTDSLPTIASVQVRAVRVPMPEPHRTASGVVAESPLVLTDITADSGEVGHSVVFTYTPTALKPTAELMRNIAPLLVGESLAPADIELKLSQRFRLLGTQGLVGMALAGFDMALWDLLARVRGVSLPGLLGGAGKSMRPYVGIGYDGVHGSALAAERWARRGFIGVKAKIGYPTVEEDLAVIRAIRSAAGEGMVIMVDYNQCLAPSEAVQRIRMLGGEGLTWVEEPTLAHDYAGHALITSATDIPIQCGENWWGIQDMQHAIGAGASDLVMPDVMKIGGVTGWLRAASLAQSHKIPLSSHLWPELSARLLSCTPTAHWLEYADWWNPILEQPLEVVDGIALTDERVGSGIDWNEAAVKKYQV
jgi:mandelate racemase